MAVVGISLLICVQLSRGLAQMSYDEAEQNLLALLLLAKWPCGDDRNLDVLRFTTSTFSYGSSHTLQCFPGVFLAICKPYCVVQSNKIKDGVQTSEEWGLNMLFS